MKKLLFTVGLLIAAGFASVFGQTVNFAYTGSLQSLTVPSCVSSVTITAYGAAGGFSQPNDEGLGAKIIGTFTVTTGDILDIMVGQKGISGNDGSGGGGSFVWNTSGNVLMIAAGGGGGGYGGNLGGNGSATTTTTAGGGPEGSAPGGAGGIGGSGGTCSGSWAGAGGGAGWLSNGGVGSNCGGYGGGGGGNTPLTGGAGGLLNGANGCGNTLNGGYGGGGASTCYGAGGGGGYNGGGGGIGYLTSYNAGGGGGSYNIGTNQFDSAGIQAVDGYVIITLNAGLNLSTTVSPVLCNGGASGSATVTASGGTPAYTYSWAPSGGTGATANNLTAGTYTISVTDASSCSGTASVVVTQPTALTASTVVNIPVLCNAGNSGKTTVTAGGGTGAYTYKWTPSGGTADTARNLTAGTYTITVTDNNGCTVSATSIITQPPALTVTTNINSTVACNGGNGGSTTATAGGGTPGYAYSWAPSGGTSDTALNLAAGSYTVTVTDNKGCTITATSTVTQPAVLTLTGSATDTAICKGNCTDVNATAGGGTASYNYTWNTGATTSSVNVCPLVKTTYTVSITDAKGCTATPVTVTVDVNPCLGINEVGSLDEQVKFYPNPFSQKVNVDISVSGPVTVTIFNMIGQNVGNYTMDKGLNTINTSGMAAGIYTLEVKTSSGILNKKLVKVE